MGAVVVHYNVPRFLYLQSLPDFEAKQWERSKTLFPTLYTIEQRVVRLCDADLFSMPCHICYIEHAWFILSC
jgi:hypothetical protein